MPHCTTLLLLSPQLALGSLYLSILNTARMMRLRHINEATFTKIKLAAHIVRY